MEIYLVFLQLKILNTIYTIYKIIKMKYVLIGDLHGTELGDLEMALSFEDIDVLVCTGDFDQVKTIRQFMDLEEKYQRAGKKVIKVPGNHDHAILNNLGITSGTLNKQGKTSSELHNELISNSIAHKYIEKLVNPRNNEAEFFLDESRYGKEFKTIVMHGAYDGDLSGYFNCPEDIKNLWFRLETEEDYAKNFDIMNKENKNYKIMIRRHNHNADYVYNDSENGIISHTPENGGEVYRLLKNRQYIINPGALFNGFFAIIDTNFDGQRAPILKYCRL